MYSAKPQRRQMRLFQRPTAIFILIATMACVSIASARPRAQAKTDPQVVAKLAQILERSGYTYRKAADNVWVVTFKGKTKGDIQVFVTSAENLIIMGAVVAPKASMKVSSEMMFK